MNLQEELEGRVEELGINYFGVADISSARNFVVRQGGEALGDYPRALALGIDLMDGIVDLLPGRERIEVASNYRHHAYDVVNMRLDAAASLMGSILQRQRYRALPVPASRIIDKERQIGNFSHKLAAHLAGLGWIGKSCMLITPGHGPRVRWVSVLTDAPLESKGQGMDEKCGDCVACVEACPADAYTGRPFRIDEDRSARFDVKRCSAYFSRLRDEGREAVCGMCLYICPHGRGASGTD